MRFSSGIINMLSLASSHGLAKTHKLDSEKLQADIKTKNLISTLYALNDIAFTSGGNRAFGLPGYQASVDYIYTRISKVGNARIWKQTFPALFTFVESVELKVDNEAIDVHGLTYSPSTTKKGITAEIALGPEGAAGCDTSSYDDLDVKGKIVLVHNFPCRTSEGLAEKVISVAAASGSAVIIYDDPTVNVAAGSLGRPNPGKYVPAGFISHSDALTIKHRIEAGETVKAHFQQTQIVEERFTQNIIAETTTGDPRNVIMLGAHLDSVQDGPGINDNGSGSSLILELFLALSNYKTKNKIRFAWWGAEENGLLGSKHYTSKLSANDVKNLLVYLNFDMVSKGFFGVADASGSSYGCKAPKGSEAIEKTFVEYFTSKGIETTPVALTNGSDYAPFWQSLGKPFGFLHTGTAVKQDPCYHKSCDSIENANSKTLTINARAAAHVLAVLDDRGTNLIHKAKTTGNIPSGL